jgi:hypothetical protein
MGKHGTTILIAVLAAVGLLFLWAWNKSKQPGSSGGIFDQFGSLWGGASNLTQNVTDKSMETGESLAHGVGSIVKDISSTAKDVISDTMPWNW